MSSIVLLTLNGLLQPAQYKLDTARPRARTYPILHQGSGQVVEALSQSSYKAHCISHGRI